MYFYHFLHIGLAYSYYIYSWILYTFCYYCEWYLPTPPHLSLLQNIIDTSYSDFFYPDIFPNTLVVPNHVATGFGMCPRQPRHLHLGVLSLPWESSRRSFLLSLPAPAGAGGTSPMSRVTVASHVPYLTTKSCRHRRRVGDALTHQEDNSHCFSFDQISLQWCGRVGFQ